MIISCDIKPQFISLELLDYLRNQKIIRPGYTTLQSVVSEIINIELKRLSTVINDSLTKDEQMTLQNLITNENTLSRLALLKQDAKDFRTRMMVAECEKLNTLRPFYLIMVRLLPLFQLSQQNIFYYSSLVNYYTSYDLREKIRTEQTYLYLLCYAWQRYQQINDNLISAFCHHIKQFSDEIKRCSNVDFEQHIVGKHEALNAMKALVQLYIDDTLSDDLSFGDVRKKAFAIIAKDQLAITLFNQFSPQKNDFYWQKVDKIAPRITLNLRPLATVLKFSSIDNIINGFRHNHG